MPTRRTAALVALTLAGTLGAAAPVHAADPIVIDAVTECAQLGDLPSAVAEVRIDGVQCAASYTITRDLTITGRNGGGFTRAIMPGDEGARSLSIDNGFDVELTGLTFRSAMTPFGIGGVSFTASSSRPQTAGSLTVTDSTFQGLVNADGGGEGGALDADLDVPGVAEPAGLTITRSVFRGNVSRRGGGVAISFAPGESNATPVTVQGSTFEGNAVVGRDSAAPAGGGLAITAPAAIASARGSAAAVADPSRPPSVELADNDYVRNRVLEGDAPAGGGAALRGVDAESRGERYLANEVRSFDPGSGGGLDFASNDGLPAVEFTGVNLVVAGNRLANGYGAGIAASNAARRDSEVPAANGLGTMDLVHATVTGNRGGWGGPGIFAASAFELRVDRSIVWGNTAAPMELLARVAGDGSVAEGPASDVPEIVAATTAGVTRSDYCEVRRDIELPMAAAQDDTVTDERGNLCTDPKLAAPYAADPVDDEPSTALPDVHQTADSPTVDAVGELAGARTRRLAAGASVTTDYDRPADARPQGKAADMGADELAVKKADPPKTDPPTTTPDSGTPTGSTPGTTGPFAPPASGVAGQSGSSPAACGSKRFFRITLRKKRGRVYRSARIWVNGTAVKVTKAKDGRPTTRVDLRRFGYDTIRIRITAKLRGGKTLKGTRTYHPCRPSLDDGVPPKL